jgi:mono/diheme cytochrome c family protein
MKKVLLSILAVLVLVIAGLIIYILATWNKTYDAPYPDIQASTDSSVIARGEYLAYGIAHCSYCHVPVDRIMDVEGGEKIPLSGGWELDIEPGIFRAPNITPDKETGIGNFTDGQIARAMRYSVKHDGSFLMPFMPFQELSDEDLTAIISFLRSQEPIKNEIEPTSYKFIGKALLAFGVVKPIAPKNTPPKSVQIDSTIAYGSYLANSVGNCVGCHTERDLKSGNFIGPDLAGGSYFEPDAFSKGYAFITPNLTPDKETGVMVNWDEKSFISRFRNGRVYEGSPMPWGAFSRLDKLELKALYRYLQSLEPISNKIEKIVFEPGDDLP